MNTTKLDLCNRIAKKVNKASPEVKAIMDLFLGEVLQIMAEEGRIELRGFGAFYIKTRKKKIGRNPRTGEVVPIPSHKIPFFKFSKEGIKIFEALTKKRAENPTLGMVAGTFSKSPNPPSL